MHEDDRRESTRSLQRSEFSLRRVRLRWRVSFGEDGMREIRSLARNRFRSMVRSIESVIVFVARTMIATPAFRFSDSIARGWNGPRSVDRRKFSCLPFTRRSVARRGAERRFGARIDACGSRLAPSLRCVICALCRGVIFQEKPCFKGISLKIRIIIIRTYRRLYGYGIGLFEAPSGVFRRPFWPASSRVGTACFL